MGWRKLSLTGLLLKMASELRAPRRPYDSSAARRSRQRSVGGTKSEPGCCYSRHGRRMFRGLPSAGLCIAWHVAYSLAVSRKPRTLILASHAFIGRAYDLAGTAGRWGVPPILLTA